MVWERTSCCCGIGKYHLYVSQSGAVEAHCFFHIVSAYAVTAAITQRRIARKVMVCGGEARIIYRKNVRVRSVKGHTLGEKAHRLRLRKDLDSVYNIAISEY